MKTKNKMNELLMAQLQTEQMRQCGEYLDMLVDTKRSIMDEFQHNRKMKIPMNEQDYKNRINDLQRRIWEIAVNYLGVNPHSTQGEADGEILQLPIYQARAP